MIFPNLAIWSSRNHARTAGEQIDRSLENRQRRLCTGLSVRPDFSAIDGCLLVTQGRGKFTRFCHATSVQCSIADPTRAACQELIQSDSPDLHQWQLSLRDLADELAQTIETLKVAAGKYVDRILAVGVVEPGFWTTDIDGASIYRGFCDATRLAELTGVNVIDEFPARDIAVGGTGSPLWPLPAWLLLADRSSPIATKTRKLLVPKPNSCQDRQPASTQKLNANREKDAKRQHELWELTLPPSDGLDAVLPDLTLKSWSLDAWLEKQKREPTREEIGDVEIFEARVLGIDSIQQTDGLTNSQPLESVLGEAVQFDSVVAAMLSLLHIDQMPANMALATGADSQRILGRLTPGSATNWRNLIRAMAQYHPAPMKLRDAI